MEEVIYWRADDGTTFDDEEECREYEWKLAMGSPRFILMGNGYKKLDPEEPSSYDDVEFIFLPDTQSVRALWNAWDTDMVSTYRPNFLEKAWKWSGAFECELGLWVYDWDREEWYHLGTKITEMQNIADKCMEVVNGAK